MLYCSENESIRLTGPPIFFTKVLFEALIDEYSKENNPDFPKHVRNYEMEEKIYLGLCNLSLNVSVLETMWQKKYVKVLYNYNIKEFMDVISKETKD